MSELIHLKTISDLFKVFGSNGSVQHPLIAVFDFSKVKPHVDEDVRITAEFYCIMYKNQKNNIKYGRTVIDFQDGSLICMAPNQVIEMDTETETAADMLGWGLYFHPDLLRGASLGEKMKDYHFFSYETSEALHLSDKEKQVLDESIRKIETELSENIDMHSQTILISTLELMLSYCTRFYGRQFITRKSSNNAVAAQIEKILNEYFKNHVIKEQGLPTVKYLADKVHLSPSYLTDLLKRETGKSAQDQIHFYLIEEAKNVLLSTDKTIAEIAYTLGFEYPQYFNKLFKKKTGKTPVEFRSLN